MNSSYVQKGTIGIALTALVLLALMVSPVSAKAADLDIGGYYYDTFVPDYGSSGYVYDTFVPDYGSSGYVYDTYVPDSYGSYSYYSPSYSSPISYYTPPAYQSQNQAQSQSQSQSQSSTNVNNNVNNNNVVVNVPTQTTTKKDKDYDRDHDYDRDVCYNLSGLQKRVPSGYYEQNGYCSKHISYNPPVYQPPYVNLSAVPYTGLELGPVGTALYWSFLVLWCLVAAYLIVVKRVQNTILEKLNGFLFGSEIHAPATGATGLSQNDLAALASMLRKEEKHSPAPIKNEVDATDEFVLSQINRNRN